mmetsp:Transcript_28893/g.62229  ORF Transcript_28893/g.62229 Transcript_28893/m.62229 type:complete len:410 (+) Transcript_28893:114-1343(+)
MKFSSFFFTTILTSLVHGNRVDEQQQQDEQLFAKTPAYRSSSFLQRNLEEEGLPTCNPLGESFRYTVYTLVSYEGPDFDFSNIAVLEELENAFIKSYNNFIGCQTVYDNAFKILGLTFLVSPDTDNKRFLLGSSIQSNGAHFLQCNAAPAVPALFRDLGTSFASSVPSSGDDCLCHGPHATLMASGYNVELQRDATIAQIPLVLPTQIITSVNQLCMGVCNNVTAVLFDDESISLPCDLVDTSTEDVAVTSDPTKSPTKRPTRRPTKKPTKRPSVPPIPAPTPGPTLLPTPAPTPDPTLQPTPEPTHDPTSTPTPKPKPLIELFLNTGMFNAKQFEDIVSIRTFCVVDEPSNVQIIYDDSKHVACIINMEGAKIKFASNSIKKYEVETSCSGGFGGKNPCEFPGKGRKD